MEDIMSQYRDFRIRVPSSSIFKALFDHVEGEAYTTMLIELYKEARKLKQQNEEFSRQIRELEKWNIGKKSFFQTLTDDDIDEIFDVFFIMIAEYDPKVDHREAATNRLDKRLDLHRNACEHLAAFMSDAITVVKKKLIPDDDFVYLDTSKLSEEEIDKIERLWASGIDERIEINDGAITFNPADIHIQDNQIVIDPEKMDPRQRKALVKSLDPDRGSSYSIALPARVLVQSGESVDEENIRAIRSFPEENPNGSPEEADPSMYGEDYSTGNEGEPNDELPFD